LASQQRKDSKGALQRCRLDFDGALCLRARVFLVETIVLEIMSWADMISKLLRKNKYDSQKCKPSFWFNADANNLAVL
jgi:hypothetical protein